MVDWLKATIEQRKALYRVLKDVADRRNLAVTALASDITGSTNSISYDKTLRSGRFSSKKAAVIANWLAQFEPRLFEKLEASLLQSGQGTPGGLWRELHRGFSETTACIIAQRHRSALPIVRPKRAQAKVQLRLHEEFYLILKDARPGFAAALQCFAGQWYPLHLFADNAIAPIGGSAVNLPVNPETGQTEFLSEEEHQGYHEIVVFAVATSQPLACLTELDADRPIAPGTLDQIAEALKSFQANAHLVTFVVTAP